MKFYFSMSIKRLLRAPTSIIFDIVFPVLILLFAVASAGNHSVDGTAMINYFISTALAKGMIPMACISFPIYVARQIENGSITRLNYFGVNPQDMYLCVPGAHGNNDVAAQFMQILIRDMIPAEEAAPAA